MLRRSHAITLLLAFVTGAAIFQAVRLSLDPDQYFFHRLEARAEWAFAPWRVVLVCGFMLAEALVVWAALVSPRPRALWLRCLLGATCLAPCALLASMVVMHAPGYVLFHHLWEWALTLLLVLTGLFSAIQRLLLKWTASRRSGSVV